MTLAPARDEHAWARRALRRMYARVWRKLKPPPRMSAAEWGPKYRVLSREETALPGRFDWDISPALREIAESTTDPLVRKVVCQKSAQVGYTAGVACNVIGYNVHHRPGVIVAAFPRTQAAKDFAAEKLDPMIRATPALRRRITLNSRAKGNSQLRKHFAGGLIKLVGSNSPSDMKSTSARVIVVEEPDDVAGAVKGQGHAIKLLEERAKTYTDHIILIGGTPTAKGASTVEDEMKTSDQRYFQVPCHSCGETHVLNWDFVTIPGLNLSEEELALPRDELDTKWPQREVYGRARWEGAFYACPHCATIWTDDQRIANIRRAERDGGGWVPTKPTGEVRGYYLNELLSTFDGSRVPVLARKYLAAKAKMDAGDINDMIAFWNSTLGLLWEYRGELPEEDELRARAERYAEWSCPAGGIEPLMFVDVQHDRLAVAVWVVGRGEEMWLAYWGELYGQTVVSHAGAWLELEQLMAKRVRHACGAGLSIKAIGIDSGDGQTNDAVYAFVRKHDRTERPVLATKGAPDAVGRIEIWTPPKHIDPNNRATKASRAGVKVHTIGAAKAKDLILGWSEHAGRVRLEGTGPGRMHWYEGVRDDFYEQMLSEIKIPDRRNPNRRKWVERKDRRNEGLDCAVGVLWLCRHLRLHLRKPQQWDYAEVRMRQAPLLGEDDDGSSAPAPTGGATPAPAAVVATTNPIVLPAPAAAQAAPPAPPPPPPPAPPPQRAAPSQPSALASTAWLERI
jgi:phage terminase large subunit GpA-like protein